MRIRIVIKRGQIWKQKGHDFYVIITGTKGGKYKAKQMTDKPNKYRNTHTLAPHTLKSWYELIS